MSVCPVCGKNVCNTICPACGFDESRNYEMYPTLQMLNNIPMAISFLRAHPAPSNSQGPVDIALMFLRAQGWDQKTLAEIQTILLAAKNLPPVPNPMGDPCYASLMNDLILVLRQYLNKVLFCFQSRLTIIDRTLPK